MPGFADAEGLWAQRLGTLRNTVRQELIARQLAEHVSPALSVLDVGCGQGTQAIRLARSGCRVVGVDRSPELLAMLVSGAAAAGTSVEAIQAEFPSLEPSLAGRTFDVVCAHGLLMYLEDPRNSLAALTKRLNDRGLLSLTFRNGAALAFRPGMRQQWAEALIAFEARAYVNELGVLASAHALDEVTEWLDELGLDVATWYGVRVFTDAVPADAPLPADGFDALLEAEFQAGRRDPYRQLGAQLHVLARRRA